MSMLSMLMRSGIRQTEWRIVAPSGAILDYWGNSEERCWRNLFDAAPTGFGTHWPNPAFMDAFLAAGYEAIEVELVPVARDRPPRKRWLSWRQ